MKVAIIGAGNVGGSTAHLILQRELAAVVLVDIITGLPQGKALDLGQSGFIEGYKPCVTGTNDYKDIEGSDIVFITAGLVRKPGMDRLDLLKKNASIIEGITKNIVKYCPDSIIIMMSNPVDVLTYHAWKLSGFPHKRVMGQAGILDTARFKYYVSRETSESIETIVMGGHGDTMLPILREPLTATNAPGMPGDTIFAVLARPDVTSGRASVDPKDRTLTELLSKEKLDSVVDKTRNGGAEIVSLMQTSAYYAPAAAAVSMIEAVLKDSKETMPVSAYLNGEYGVNDVYIGVPVVLGKNGVEKVLEIELTADEKDALQRSASSYKENIKKI